MPSHGSSSSMSFAEVAALIRARRTNLFVDPDRGVPRELIDGLCELATWAPCHKRTWPWRFAVVTGTARAELGAVAAASVAATGAEAAKVEKTKVKYLRAPVVVVVGATSGDSPLRSRENRDAVSAAIQNLLLAATAAGLASYWSSCPPGAEAAVASYAGFDDGTTIVAMVYLGWPIRECHAPARPPLDIVRVGVE